MRIPYVVLTSLVLLFTCGFFFDRVPAPAQHPGTVKIVYWEKWTGFEGEAMQRTISLFNSKQIKNTKGETIHCDYLTMTQVDRKSLLAIAGGNPPDLAGFWSNNTYSLADMGALTPLDEYFKRDHFDTEKYIDVYLQSCQYRSKTWCLPTTPATVALHWNKDLFRAAGLNPERPPQTMDELLEYAEKLTKRDEKGNIVQMGFLPTEPGWWNWGWGFFWGGRLCEGLDKITATDPKNVEAWNWMSRFAEKYGRKETYSYRQGFGSFDSPQNAFLNGKVAMVIQGVWMANFIRFHNPHLNWGCGPCPAAFETGGQPVTIAEMDVITIPRGAKHPEEAWEVMKFINSTEGMEFLCGGVGNRGGQGKLTPFKTTTPGWIDAHLHPHLQVFIDLAKSKNAMSCPKLPMWDEYKAELQSAFDSMWLGTVTPEQALQNVQNRMQPKLTQLLKSTADAKALEAERTK